MKHRRVRRWVATAAAPAALALVVAWWFGFLPGATLRFEPKPFNIIVITADTVRADKLGAYGNALIATPNVDRLAAQGVLFEQATTVVPLTLPAHSSIFTGTFPMFHGVRDNGGYYLDAAQTTLAEVLKAQGYATGAFVGAFVLDSRWGLGQGFDRYFDDFNLAKYEKVSLDSVQRRGDEVLGQALPWMESVRNQRFFSWIHLYDAHTPYDPPEPYLSRYAGVRWGRYDGEIAWVDSLVGRVMSWLDEQKLADRTIVAFLADHGESLGEHKEAGHGFFIYDATTHVPFILRTPYRALKGRRVSSQVRVIDVMPTLLNLVGAPIPAAVQGTSLVDVIGGHQRAALAAYSESYYPRHHYGWSELKALREGGFLYVAAPHPELFDLSADPRQQHDLASERPSTVARLSSELAEITGRYSARDIDDKRPETVDPETQARLAALGYIAGPSKVRVDSSKALADPKEKIELFNLIKDAGGDSSEGRVDAALEKIQRVLQQDPGILEAHHILGNLYVKKNEREKAVAAYQQALALDAEYVPAVFSLASTYKELGRIDEAMAGFQRLIELDPHDNGGYFNLAKIHAEKKQFRPALDLLKRAVDMGSERAPLHNLMAECYLALKQLDAAEREVRRALEMSPELPTAQFNLALVMEERGDLPRAIEAYTKEIANAPRSFMAHFNLAKLYGKTGQPSAMMEHFEKAVEINEQFAIGYLYLAKANLDKGDVDAALRLATKGVTIGPERSMAPFGHFLLVDIYNRLGRSQEAARELALARRLQQMG
jgi:arylsulfatase A-like enzyme/lipopolysaccharide biosynthesis regulator YciM